jgi:hypothetical protein
MNGRKGTKMNRNVSRRKPLIPALLITGVFIPLIFVLRSPQIDAVRTVDFILIFAAGISAGAILSLTFSALRQTRGQA